MLSGFVHAGAVRRGGLVLCGCALGRIRPVLRVYALGRIRLVLHVVGLPGSR